MLNNHSDSGVNTRRVKSIKWLPMVWLSSRLFIFINIFNIQGYTYIEKLDHTD